MSPVISPVVSKSSVPEITALTPEAYPKLSALAPTVFTEAPGAGWQDNLRTIGAATGRVIVSGMGKSGLVGRKIAATLAAPSPSQEATAEPVAWPNWFGWRSVDTAPEDQHVILATSGGHVGEAIMLIDEDTGTRKWAWAMGPVHHHHTPFGWMPLPDALQSPVASDLRPGGFDGPTGAE